MKKRLFVTAILFLAVFSVKAQNLPPIKALRAEENFSILLQNDSLRIASFFNQIKAVQLNKSKSIYLTFGGEFRPRWEVTVNKTGVPKKPLTKIIILKELWFTLIYI